mgnify:CR=1 FL=1
MILRTPYPDYSLLDELAVINSKKEPSEKAGWKKLSMLVVEDCKEGDEFLVMVAFLAKNESLRKRKPKGLSVRVTPKVFANGTEIIPAGGYNITPEGHYGLFSRQGTFKLSKTLKGFVKGILYVPYLPKLEIDLYIKAACTSAKESDYIEFGDITSIQVVKVN